MRAFICVDDDIGRLFGSRRQSRDGTLCADMIKTVGDGLLYIEKYSEPLFSDFAEKVCVCAEPPKDDSYFFFEKTDPEIYGRFVSEWTIYRWNRLYPSDEKFSKELLRGFRLTATEEFVGSSHEKITKEAYVRE